MITLGSLKRLVLLLLFVLSWAGRAPGQMPPTRANGLAQSYLKQWGSSYVPGYLASNVTSPYYGPVTFDTTLTHTLNGAYEWFANVQVDAYRTIPGSSAAFADCECSLEFSGPGIVTVNHVWLYIKAKSGSNPLPVYSWSPEGVGADVGFPYQNDWSIMGSSNGSIGLARAQYSIVSEGNRVRLRLTASALSVWSGGDIYSQVQGQIVVQLSVSQPTATVERIGLVGDQGGNRQRAPMFLPPGQSLFRGVESGLWFDPPMAIGYDFQQAGTSLFTGILELPIGIDGDGLFEVQAEGQILGPFAEGSAVDFVQALGHGVSAFRIVGIDPAKDVGDNLAFPVKLAFNTPTADFTMTPVTWRSVGTACSDPVCTTCPSVSLSPVGDAVAGNSSFGVSLQNVPANSGALWAVGIGSAVPSPVPLHCGDVYLPQPWIPLVITFLPGTSGCDAGGVLPFPLPTGPTVAGTFLTVQVGTQCPEGGIGITQAIEFAVGS